MGKVVILEGPDGSGKTTLATQLMAYGFEYLHEGPPNVKVDLLAHYLRILDFALNHRNNVVIDRLWLGERIYGPLFRNTDRIGDEGQRLFDRLHVSKPILHYVCLPKLEIAEVNYIQKMKEKDDYVRSLTKWREVYSRYSSWLSNHGTVGMVYNYRKHRPNTILEDIHDMDSNRVRLPNGTIGNPKAKYLFIGDRPNHSHIDVPFFAFDGSSGYFNTALLRAGIQEKDLAISNAFSATGEEHDAEEILSKFPNLQKIILMGNKAYEWFHRKVKYSKVTAHGIYHPSYFKRFKGHNPEVMADTIKELI